MVLGFFVVDFFFGGWGWVVCFFMFGFGGFFVFRFLLGFFVVFFYLFLINKRYIHQVCCMKFLYKGKHGLNFEISLRSDIISTSLMPERAASLYKM